MWLERPYFSDDAKAFLKQFIAKLEGAIDTSATSSQSSSKNPRRSQDSNAQKQSSTARESRISHSVVPPTADGASSPYNFSEAEVEDTVVDAVAYDYGEDEDDEERIQNQRRLLEQDLMKLKSDNAHPDVMDDPVISGMIEEKEPEVLHPQTPLRRLDSGAPTGLYFFQISHRVSDNELKDLFHRFGDCSVRRLSASEVEVFYDTRMDAENARARLSEQLGSSTWIEPNVSSMRFPRNSGEYDFSASSHREDIHSSMQMPISSRRDHRPHDSREFASFNGQQKRSRRADEDGYQDDFKFKRGRAYH